jgi:hypothetical protein
VLLQQRQQHLLPPCSNSSKQRAKQKQQLATSCQQHPAAATAVEAAVARVGAVVQQLLQWQPLPTNRATKPVAMPAAVGSSGRWLSKWPRRLHPHLAIKHPH